MNLEDKILKIIDKKINDDVEFRTVLPTSKAIAKIMASFANTSGGYLIIGVKSTSVKNEVVGLSSDFYITNIIYKAIELLEPNENSFNHKIINISNKRLLVLSINKSIGTVFVNDKKYIRESNHTIEFIENIDESQWEYQKLIDLKNKLDEYLQEGTEAKKNYFEHIESILKIMNDLKNILYPEAPLIVTTNDEGKILTRILYSTFIDNFETYLSDLLFEICLAKPATLKSQETVTIEDVLNCSDMQDFIHYWTKQKINKLQKGSVKGFIKENKQISSLDVIEKEDINKIEKLLQIRHLYSHKNGRIDEKFLEYFRDEDLNINDLYELSVEDICNKILYIVETTEKLDNKAIEKYSLF
jgi:tetrahydromethanopterin S-methyltransferase subunit A